MENILNDKIKKCYSITKKVADKYTELLPIMINNAMEDVSVYQTYIDDIMELILSEYDAYRCLSISDINICLDLLSKLDEKWSMVNYRFKLKLKVFKDILDGNKISSCLLGLKLIKENIDFDIFPALSGLIDIKAMKLVKNKLDSLCIDNDKDFYFVSELYREFNFVLFYELFDNDLMEFVVLTYNMEIEKVPDIDINIICNHINNIFSLDNDSYFKPVDATFIELAKVTINKLFEIDFVNSPDITFKNLLLITRFEVLISYMKKDDLFTLLEYCESYVHNNNFGINNAIKLIKDKVRKL